MVAAVAAALSPHAPARMAGEGFQRLRGVMLGPSRSSAPAARSASARRLVADGLQLGHTLLEHRIGDVGDPVFDRVVEPLELGVCFGTALAQFGDVHRPALRALFTAVEQARQDLFETLGGRMHV